MTLTSVRPALTVEGGAMLRNGTPHRILAGSIHYFRVHPDQWADRLERLAAMGLNTVDTYVAWNFHRQLERDAVDFTGWRDLGRFIRLAGDQGLDVIVRPGPYICAEWDNGGLPAWVTAKTGERLRSADPGYLALVDEWFDALVPQFADLQAATGGPVVAVQVENEYGSFGDDAAYLAHLRDGLRDRGITELLYTADGPTDLMLDGGTVPGTFAAATFGTRPDEAERMLRARRPDDPFLCAEFWNGWFDHWGTGHHTRSAVDAAETLRGILDRGSVSVYMAHGGTNFGLWSGANFEDGVLLPTVTSYDSDAPVSEHGALTPKFHAYRELLADFGADTTRPVPADPVTVAPAPVALLPGESLLDAGDRLAVATAAPDPRSFDELGIASGLVVYRARPRIPEGETTLTISGLHDRATVFVDGVALAAVADEESVVPITGRGRAVDLAIVVENQGRINYGPRLGTGKGILGHVRVERRKVHGWTMHPLALDRLSAEQLGAVQGGGAGRAGSPSGFASAEFDVEAVGDTFVAFPGARRGFAWVNGFLLGRYRHDGPQRTLYVPAPLLRPGRNSLVVLELEGGATRAEFADAPDLGESVLFRSY